MQEIELRSQLSLDLKLQVLRMICIVNTWTTLTSLDNGPRVIYGVNSPMRRLRLISIFRISSGCCKDALHYGGLDFGLVLS